MDRHETVVRNHEQSRPSREIALQLIPHFAYSVVGILDRRIGRRTARPLGMLGVICLQEVQQRQVGMVLVQDHVENPGGSGVARFHHLLAAGWLPEGDALSLTRLQQRRGSVFQHGFARGHVGQSPIQGLGVARCRPPNCRGLVAIGFRQVVKRRHLHDLLLVVNRVPDQPHPLAGGAVQVIIAYDSMPCRTYPGHERGVARPGDAGGRDLHAACAGARGRQRADGWHLRLGIVQVIAGQPVHADHDHHLIGGFGGDAWRGSQQEQRP